MTPGPWLRLLAIASTAGVAAVVATGEWGLAHDVVANITLVLLAAVVLCARLAHRNRRTLLSASGSAFLLFALAGLSALVGAPTTRCVRETAQWPALARMMNMQDHRVVTAEHHCVTA